MVYPAGLQNDDGGKCSCPYCGDIDTLPTDFWELREFDTYEIKCNNCEETYIIQDPPFTNFEVYKMPKPPKEIKRDCYEDDDITNMVGN
jgi:hypothetical protein